jgi:hypothetical protein
MATRLPFFFGSLPVCSIYDLFPFCLLELVHKATLAMVDRLRQNKKEANHKLRNLRQQLRRQNVAVVVTVADLSDMDVDEEMTCEELRNELDVLRERVGSEDERLRRLVYGTGKGRPKSLEFEFAARTILASGTTLTYPSHVPSA